MPDDIPTLLRQAAAEPRQSPDFEQMAARGRRQHVTALVTAAVVAVVAVGAGGLWLLPKAGTSTLPIIGNGAPEHPVRNESVRSGPDGWHELHVGGAIFGVPGDWTVETYQEPVSVCPNMADAPTAYVAQSGFEPRKTCEDRMAATLTVEAAPLSSTPASWLAPQGTDDWQTITTDGGVSGLRIVRNEQATVVAYRFPHLDLWLQFGAADRLTTEQDPILATVAPAPDASTPEAISTGPDRECPPGDNPLYDPVDFLLLDGRTYVADGRVNDLEPSDLGERIGQVVCRYSTVDHETYGPPRHGDAATLDPNTSVYALRGVDPGFRVVADDNGRLRLYEAHRAPNAAAGREVFDIDARVTSIDITRRHVADGPVTTGHITDGVQIRQLVDALLGAPTSPDRQPSTNEIIYELQLHLTDGPPLELLLYPTDNLLGHPWLTVPPTFTDRITQTVHEQGPAPQ